MILIDDLERASPRLLLGFARNLTALLYAARFPDTVAAFGDIGVEIEPSLQGLETLRIQADNILIDRELADIRFITDAERVREVAARASRWFEELDLALQNPLRAGLADARFMDAALQRARKHDTSPLKTYSSVQIVIHALRRVALKPIGLDEGFVGKGHALAQSLVEEPRKREAAVHDRGHASDDLEDLITQIRELVIRVRNDHERARFARNGRPVPGFDAGVLTSTRPDREPDGPAESLFAEPAATRTFLPGGLDGEEDESVG